MPNYNNGKIYKITGGGLTYIGSTTISCSRRFAHHKGDYKRFKQGKRCYLSSFKLLDFDDCVITLIEDYPCQRKEQLLMRERFWMEHTECVNIKRPIINCLERIENKQNYYVNHKNEILENGKMNYKNNKEKINERHNNHYQLTKDVLNAKTLCCCGSSYSKTHRERHFRTTKHQDYLKLIKVNP